MKRSHRWGSFAAVVGGSLVSLLVSAGQVLALTPQEIAKKLEAVPVFALFNPKTQQFAIAGATIEGKQIRIFRTFMDQQEAQQALQQIKGRGADFTGFEIRPMSMAFIYLQLQVPDPKAERPQFQVVPDEKAIKNAVDTLKAEGKTAENVQGIPLFFAPELAWVRAAGPNQQGQPILPMYFSPQDLQSAIQEAKKREPKLAAAPVKVQVTTLERVVAVMAEQKDPNLGQVEFVPPLDSLEYVRKTQPAQPAAAPAGKPQQPAQQRGRR